jgi:hypothetical protein
VANPFRRISRLKNPLLQTIFSELQDFKEGGHECEIIEPQMKHRWEMPRKGADDRRRRQKNGTEVNKGNEAKNADRKFFYRMN